MSGSTRHPHLGRLIAEILKARGMTKAAFGRRISTSRQNVSLILKKESIDTEMLWRIGRALETDLFQVISQEFSDGLPERDGHCPTGRLEIRLEIADRRLSRMTTDLIKSLVADHRSTHLEIAGPDDAGTNQAPT